MLLTHFSNKPLRFRKSEPYTEERELLGFKPSGFWLSDEGSDLGWSKWCKQNKFRRSDLRYRAYFKVDLSRWKVIKTDKQLVSFSKTFQRKNEPWHNSLYDDAFKLKFNSIDWDRVKKRYAGVLITPYLWSMRHRYNWYYGWDCASGCVWDLSTIKRVWR